ncbi:Spy/CpxP family protein refolding chaperone [Desulfovibrio litoralis]|uniref:Zinc resistance-associated protein n=1 Tax=Desulfovibrio litoralis DSM 11393 TaxID=1121455 RepID=A0A1M7RZZ1_9BACT|nr:periplasmic heavy metal sensor [Desulfovibrio litoralis]SHN51634.1 zinc resistance-associated protein [Desulfovibrio litoralis DSM 11393]
MKNLTKTIAMALCLSFALTGTALAQGMGKGMGNGMGQNKTNQMQRGSGYHHNMKNGGWDLSPEKQEAYNKIMKEASDKLTPIQDKMWAKHTELQALASNPKTEPATISKLVQELQELRIQMRTERELIATKLEKEVGISSNFGRGMMGGKMMMGGKGMKGGMGMGSGMGHGMGQGMGRGMYNGDCPMYNQAPTDSNVN